jgi:hypothetical protein
MSLHLVKDSGFREKIRECLEQAVKVLDTNKNKIELFSHETHPHTYDDKFSVVDGFTNMTILCLLNCIRTLGVTESHLATLNNWFHKDSCNVFLRIEVATRCEYVKEVQREEDNAVRNEEQVTVGSFSMTLTAKVVMMITEYLFEYGTTIKISAYRRNGESPDDVIELQSRSATQEILQQSKTNPPGLSKTLKHFDVNIGWLLSNFDSFNSAAKFKINRSHKKCHTPANNAEVVAALAALSQLNSWSSQVVEHVRSHVFQKYQQLSKNPKSAMTPFSAESSLLVPIIPAVATRTSSDVASFGLTVPSSTAQVDENFTALAAEHYRRLGALRETVLTNTFESAAHGASLYTVHEAEMVTLLTHISELYGCYSNSVAYMERMIRSQLIAAVGKTLSSVDFHDCYLSHSRKLWAAEFAQKPFSFSVRRTPTHSSEGFVSIEQQCNGGGRPFEPIHTFSARLAPSENEPMKFPLSSSTTVSFTGERFVHGWLMHSFSSDNPDAVRLNVRAKQFSSFIVMLGNIASATVFEPKHAFIVQNKDELTIPLMLETIPTAQQFKKAIVSISEAQQRFAKAYRAMQLESTLFGVLIVQIKPQLEKIMRIPSNSLTKEIQLTQNLLRLMMKYQIPSDQLSYDPDADSTAAADGGGAAQSARQLNFVKGNVVKMQDMIKECEEAELEEAKRQLQYSQPLLDMTNEESDSSRDSPELYVDEVDEEPMVYEDRLYSEPERRSSLVSRVWDSFFGCSSDGAIPTVGAAPPEIMRRARLARGGGGRGGEPRGARRNRDVDECDDEDCGDSAGGSFRGIEDNFHSIRSMQQRQIMEEQDRCLESLGAAVDRLEHVSKTITQELCDQSRMLDDLENEVAGTSAPLGSMMGAIGGLFRGKKQDAPPPPPPVQQQAAPLAKQSDSKVTSKSPSAPPKVPPPPQQAKTGDSKTTSQSQPARAATPQQSKINEADKEQDLAKWNPSSSPAVTRQSVDLTTIPNLLDARLEEFDVDSAVHSTIIRPDPVHIAKTEQKSLLATAAEEKGLNESELEAEKQAAYTLLDTLSKSGGLVLENCTSLHVVVGATHCFDLNLMDSIVKENINPVERVDRSALIMASVVYGQPPQQLIDVSYIDAVVAHSPHLF